jgi:hypothetical protein
VGYYQKSISARKEIFMAQTNDTNDYYAVDDNIMKILDEWEKNDPAFTKYRKDVEEIYDSLISVRDSYAGENDDLPVWDESTNSLLRYCFEWAKEEKNGGKSAIDYIEAMCNPELFCEDMDDEDDSDKDNEE